MYVIENNLVKTGSIIIGSLWLRIDSTHTSAKSTLGRFNYIMKYSRREYGYAPSREGYYAQFKVSSGSNELVNDNNYSLQQSEDYQIFINSLIAE